jgi:excinuclease ABC subunit C
MTAMGTPVDPFDAKAFCRTLTPRAGVYRMLDGRGAVLYVGKARNLRKRVSSYFGARGQVDSRIRSMLGQVRAIDVTVTRTEGEALLLESNLIKEHKPRYNVVLRDDKSYPYIYLSSDQTFPRLSFHRGARSGAGRYFGPYPSAGAVRETLNLLQKLFQIRSCEDSYFRNRSRPCLQFQIRRCTAPCVGAVDPETYASDVAHAVLFLEGRSQEAIDALVQRMEAASKRLDYERAARYRDQIHSLQRVQQRQYMSAERGDVDIVACLTRDGLACVQVFYIRGGRNLGNRAFFPAHAQNLEPAAVLNAFLAQYYLSRRADRSVPGEILLSQHPEDAALLAQALAEIAGHAVKLRSSVRGDRARWLAMALENAAIALEQRLAADSSQRRRMEALQAMLALEEPLERVECFDVSHTGGGETVASCVVFGPDGPVKSDYRRFNVTGIAPGDDYAALAQVLERRYSRVKREDAKLPDLILIDGGTGQVNAARVVLEELQIGELPIVGVAKGPARRAGQEHLVYADGGRARRLPPDSAALHAIQQIRDEAHRFAITGHRQRRARARSTSLLERIPGVGEHRRRNLIRHFGGLQGVSRAAVEDLNRVPGISRALAEKIYDALHGV